MRRGKQMLKRGIGLRRADGPLFASLIALLFSIIAYPARATDEPQPPTPPPTEIYLPHILAVEQQSAIDERVRGYARKLGQPDPLAPKNVEPSVDPNGMVLGAPIPLGRPTPSVETPASDRNRLRDLPQILAIAIAVLAGLNAFLYLREPLRGPRRMSLAASAAAGAVAIGALAIIVAYGGASFTSVLVLMVSEIGVLTGVGMLAIALLTLAAVRWVRSGFTHDKRAPNAAAHPMEVRS